MFKVPEKYRFSDPLTGFYSTKEDGNNGGFFIPSGSAPCGSDLVIIASDGLGWEHVSVSIKGRNPNWDEMCFVKDLFWGPEDCVVQYHPPKKDDVNNCVNCLHLWAPKKYEIPRPDSILVGFKDEETKK